MTRSWSGVCLLAALLACAPVPQATKAPAPRPSGTQIPPVFAPDSPASAALRDRYARVQATLLSRGLMRTDGGGTDTGFGPEILARTFARIALYEEFDRAQGGTIRQEAPIRLARWAKPIRVGLRFGGSIPAEKVAAERARVTSFLARLAGLTGLSIRLDEQNPNFIIQFANLEERRALGPVLRAAMPNLTEQQIGAVTSLNRDTFCLVWTEIDAATSTYDRAFVFIPAEHPDLMRLSCLHEEASQALGLPNDSPTARPSIFNDDEEFALLTRMDEAMLRMLYSPELRPGMTQAQADPLLLSLARRHMPGGS